VLHESAYPNHAQLDLTDQAAVAEFFDRERPEYVFLAAAKVGGIHANNNLPGDVHPRQPGDPDNVIHQAWRHGVKRLLFLGSSCIYPQLAPQPLREEHLLTGTLEPTNEPYAIAKIAGLKMCEAYNRQYGTRFVAVMPPISMGRVTTSTRELPRPAGVDPTFPRGKGRLTPHASLLTRSHRVGDRDAAARIPLC